MDWALVVEWTIKSILMVLILLAGFAWGTLYERRLLARMQVRIGPNRTGPQGLLQPVADGIKLIFKEELIPDKADKLIFFLAPILTVVPALVISGVVPWGTSITLFGRIIPLYLTDINLAVLYILTVTSISIYGITLAGWSSNNKYAMMGGLRSTAQMISYELALGLSFVSVTLLAGSMSLVDIVEAQGAHGILGWIIWNLSQPLGLIIFFIAGMAETNRSPFDMPEAEQELTAGYSTEYSGMKFALFYMAEYIKIIAISMITVTLFLGGYLGPFIDQLPWLGPIYLFIKTVIVIFVFIWVRATFPRFRYDRLMAFGWKVLLPLGFLNMFIAGIITVLRGG